MNTQLLQLKQFYRTILGILASFTGIKSHNRLYIIQGVIGLNIIV